MGITGLAMIVKTMCARDCPDACWLDVHVENNTIVEVKASTENPVTNGLTCPRARGDPERTTSMDRVLYPYIKKKGEPGFNKVEWEEALETVTSKLTETIENHGRESVLLLDYAGNTGFIASGYSKRLWSALGVTVTDYTVCSASGHAAINLHYGLSYGSQPMDLESKKNIVFWGNNAKVSTPHQWALATRARRNNDAEIIVIDPRESETAEVANLYLCPNPGTDVALAYGIAHYLITNDLIDSDFLTSHTTGFDEYREEALKWTPERVEEITGIPWEGVVEMCTMLLEGSSVFMIGLGLNKSLTGAESCRAVSLLPALLGAHRGFYYTNSRGRYLPVDTSGASLTEKKPKVVSMISLGQRLEAGDFKFVYVFGMNPALTLPDSTSVVNGLKRDDVFLVVHDTHITETADLANVVLPATTYLEKDDFFISDCHPYVRLGRKAIEPLAESLDEHVLMKIMATGLEVEEEWVYADPWADLESNLVDSFVDGTFSDLLSGKSLTVKSRPMDEYQTPSGKIEFASSTVPEGVTPLPYQFEIPVADDEFIMLNSALPKYTHTQFRDVYDEIPCQAWINPDDVDTLELDKKKKLTLYNESGELEVDAVVTRKVPQGVIWCPRELKDSKGNIQNSLAEGTPQVIGGGPMFNTTRVRIRQ